LTTKIHLAADQDCRPMARVVTAGQRHDAVAFTAVMADLKILRSGGTPCRTRPDRVLADKAYSSQKIRNQLRRRSIRATIPQPANQVQGRKARGPKGGRPPTFDKVIYKNRNTVERTINRLRGYRAVATRYDKREFMYRGTIESPPSESGSGSPPTMISGTRPSQAGPARSTQPDVEVGGACACFRGGRRTPPPDPAPVESRNAWMSTI
jgi:transposase